METRLDEAILERLKRNEEIARRFFEVETSILSIFSFRDLFERLLAEIREKFQIPFVWVSMFNENEVGELIKELISSEVLKERLNIVDKGFFLGLLGNATTPVLVNSNLSPFFRILPSNEKYLIRSLAIAPITLNGEIIGSLNFGDSSSLRYSPGMDTSLLERLAVKVSICLSNVIAHERVEASVWKDPVTGLYNRTALRSLLEMEFKRSVRYETPLSVIYLALADFDCDERPKEGYLRESVLQAFACRIRKAIRDTDIPGKLGPEGYAVVLPNTDKQKAKYPRERIASALEQRPFHCDERVVYPMVTLGVCAPVRKEMEQVDRFLDRIERITCKARKSRVLQTRLVRLRRRGE